MDDLRYCLRSLARTPGFTATVLLTLGIGANTAIFSIVDAVLLRALPFPNPEQLVRVVDGNSTGGGRPERIEALAISFNYFRTPRR